MEKDIALTLITLGGLFFLGLATDVIGRRTRLPRVTLLLAFGFIIGSSVLNILPTFGEKRFHAIADVALVMVGFLLGEKFTLNSLRQYGRFVLCISATVVFATAMVVLVGLLLIGVRPDIALLLAGISTATAPAATVDVVRETGADGPFTRTLLGIVAVDDAWGLIAFSLILAIAQMINGHGDSVTPLLIGAWEISGAVLVGICLGIQMAYLTGRVREGEPTLVEALGVVFLCAGITIRLGVSPLLASMVMGTVVANLAQHHKRPFHAIEGIEWPFMIVFFVLAGASLRIESISKIGTLGAAYVILRIIGRLIGGRIGGTISHASPLIQRWMGIALMPQAGVALGMALVASRRFPDIGETLLQIVIGATILFELAGPVLTRIALNRAGEVRTTHLQEHKYRQ